MSNLTENIKFLTKDLKGRVGLAMSEAECERVILGIITEGRNYHRQKLEEVLRAYNDFLSLDNLADDLPAEFLKEYQSKLKDEGIF